MTRPMFPQAFRPLPLVMTRLVPVLLVCLLLSGLPARAEGPKTPEEAGLVEVVKLDPSLILDIRYATENNFTGKTVYPSARCYLRQEAAQALVLVQKDLRTQGLGLKIYDGYRPFSVQKIFWKIMPDQRYVFEPVEENGKMVKGSRHNRGMAVDLTLVDAKGQELPMPTPYDDFTDKAHRNSTAASPEIRSNALLLERAMVRRGFIPLSTEWWHFDMTGFEQAPLLDAPIQ